MPSAGATWELVLVALLFVLLTVLFALRLRAAFSSPSTDGRTQASSLSESGPQTGSTTRSRTHTRPAPPATDSARHELAIDAGAEHDVGSQSIPRDVLSESLTDEDRVLRMLAANNGRLRQQVIVERTDWSKSKVSRLLSKMNEKGSIEKISVGRENVITFPSDDPAGEPLGETR